MRYYLLAIASFIFTYSCEPPIADQGSLQLLFLGHEGDHHNGKKYMPILASYLAPKGIQLTWASDPGVLNPKELNKFDGLILYANHDSIAPSQEKALLQFIRKGKAFLPIHSASYCFRNSDAFVDLVGAQFESHGIDSFSTEIVQADHPIVAGFQSFETWDETYVHHRHNPDREVLMERMNGGKREPWTWTRTYGKGRIFYTAYGHDERTWSHPGFLDLIERGIRWAIGPERETSLSSVSLPKLSYEASEFIPNYENRPQPLPLQHPLSPEESRQMIQVPQGFSLELFASEPDIINPIAMSWDEKGRLWVLETKDYPNVVRPQEEGGRDVLKILEDWDGDGKVDTVKIFADNLNIPTGMVFANGGVILSQAPDFLFLKDTDGDDKADIRKVLFSGWGTYDTHAGPSNLKYGFDNWIWGTVGYSGFEGKVGNKEHKFSMGVYRFKADGSDLEYITRFTNNTWGLGFNEEFDIFGSTANNEHSVQVAIPDRYLQGVKGIRQVGILKIDGHYGARPITQNVRQVDVHMGFTAAAGINLYTARNYPREYWNRIAFVNEPTLHLLHRAILDREGSVYQERDGFNMLASIDEWVSPVHAEVGPDGALWVADWYNFIVQHNPTPEGFENGKGNAHVNPLRDKQHGRIYRILNTESSHKLPISIDPENSNTWVKALQSENMLWRMHGQRLIVENHATEVLPQLLALVKNTGVDEIGLNSPAVHALWALKGLEMVGTGNANVDKVVLQALKHPAAGVRKATIQVLPPTESHLERLLDLDVFADEDKRIVLAALLWLTELPSSEFIGNLILQLSKSPQIYEDYWCSKAVYAAASKHKNATLATLRKEPDFDTFLQPEMKWYAQDPSTWDTVHLPKNWERTTQKNLHEFDGIALIHREFELTYSESKAPANIFLGPMDDSDSVRINGELVGFQRRDWIGPPHSYDIPSQVLKSGTNTLRIWTHDRRGPGGYSGEASSYYIQTNNRKIPLAGTWKYKVVENFLDKSSAFKEPQAISRKFVRSYLPSTFIGEDTIQTAAKPADRQIFLKAVRDLMKYDRSSFTVEAGETIEIVFENVDAMQHNFLLIAPGSIEKVGEAADLLATDPRGGELQYVPGIEEVLFSSELVDPGQTVQL
ncbi:MAG: PVC-type heme-binding CxxCH protein, partial [Bacteroidota bacterium]